MTLAAAAAAAAAAAMKRAAGDVQHRARMGRRIVNVSGTAASAADPGSATSVYGCGGAGKEMEKSRQLLQAGESSQRAEGGREGGRGRKEGRKKVVNELGKCVCI